MADKKITELTELSTAKQGDLLVVVDNPTGTPITKKITATNLFGNVTYITPSTDVSAAALSSAKFTLVSNVAYTATNSTVTAATFLVTANAATSTNTKYQYAFTATSLLDGATANVKVEHAAAKFAVDVSNSATLIANTYGVVVSMANTGTRVANTQAFFALTEASATAYTASTLYLFEAKNVTANLSAAGNTTGMLSNSASTGATHKLKIRVNGVDYWLVLSSNGA